LQLKSELCDVALDLWRSFDESAVEKGATGLFQLRLVSSACPKAPFRPMQITAIVTLILGTSDLRGCARNDK